MNGRARVWGLVAAIVVAGIALSGCCGLLSSAGSTPDAGTSAAPAKVLAKFFDASTKSGRYDNTTVSADGSTNKEQAEFWVDGRMFRIDYYKDGKLRISIRSNDGKTAYFCHADKQTAEPSVATPDVYLRKFTKPEKAGTDMGTDPTTGAARIKYVLKETSNVPGSSNAWYVEDLVYSIKDGRLLSVVDRGGIPHEGEATKLSTNTTLFTELVTGEDIPPETFEIPYPIKAAK